jgi:hypothetical protein
MVQKLVPLCSSQYERQFNTVRIPGKETGIRKKRFFACICRLGKAQR